MSPRARAARAMAAIRRRHVDEAGIALATVIVVMMVLTAIGATVSLMGTNNLKNAARDRQAGSSLGAGDAGAAQAIEYLRSNGLGAVTCPDANPSACSSNPAGWSNPTNPQLVPLDAAGTGCNGSATNCAKVWIGWIQQYAPPAAKVGIYNIHSEGMYGPGPSLRRIVTTVEVTPDKYPIGVFGQTLSGNGGTALYTESLFTTQCISPRWNGSGNGTRFQGIDSYWGQPAAAHTTSHVSTTNSCGSNGYIASSSPTATTASNAACPNNTALNYDQTGEGGLVSGTAGAQCYRSYTRPDGTLYPDGVCPPGVTSTRADGLCDTTAFTTADLQRYGYIPRGLTDAQYAALKSRAKGMGTFNITVSSVQSRLASLLSQGINHPVLYWDCSTAPSSICSGSSALSLSYSDLPAGAFTAPPSSAGSCANPYQTVTVVVEHGTMIWQGGNNTWADAAFFVPDGSFNANGGYNIVGTLFSNNLSLGGNQTFTLDPCWVSNFPGALLTVKVTKFHEDDSTDAP